MITPQDKKYMDLALRLARKADGMTSPTPRVGAVVVKSGRIVGKGYHRRAGTPHAEIHALKEAGEKHGWQVYIPKFEYCTDNAAMIGITGYYKYLKGAVADLSVSPSARAVW